MAVVGSPTRGSVSPTVGVVGAGIRGHALAERVVDVVGVVVGVAVVELLFTITGHGREVGFDSPPGGDHILTCLPLSAVRYMKNGNRRA